MKSVETCRTTLACFTRNALHALHETQNALHTLHETQNALKETLNSLQERFTVNMNGKPFTGNDSRTEVAPFIGVFVRFKVCKYPDYLVLFGASPYVRCLFFVPFEPNT